MNVAVVVALIIRYFPQVASFVFALETQRRRDLDAAIIVKKDSEALEKAFKEVSDEEANRIIRNTFNNL